MSAKKTMLCTLCSFLLQRGKRAEGCDWGEKKPTWSLRLGTFQRPAGWRWSRPSGVSPHRTGESPERRKREVIEHDEKSFCSRHRIRWCIHSQQRKIDFLLLYQWTHCSRSFFWLWFFKKKKKKRKSWKNKRTWNASDRLIHSALVDRSYWLIHI